MMKMEKLPDFTLKEEFLHSLTHAIGAVISFFLMWPLVKKGLDADDSWELTGNTFFGLSLIILYVVSASYHGCRNRKVKVVLRYLDHISVFILIAGTYSALALSGVKGKAGLALFFCSWILAITGSVLKVLYFDLFFKVSVYYYLAMGYLVVAFGKPVLERCSPKALILIVLGGISYTVGVFFFQKNTVRYLHVVFHLFVLLGSAFHFIAVYFYM